MCTTSYMRRSASLTLSARPRNPSSPHAGPVRALAARTQEVATHSQLIDVSLYSFILWVGALRVGGCCKRDIWYCEQANDCLGLSNSPGVPHTERMHVICLRSGRHKRL